MENNPAQLLMDEHDVIVQLERTINAMDQLWLKDPQKYKDLVSKALYFFRAYSDGFHHAKEEEILFPELIDHPDFLLNEIIDELKEHHEMFREYTREIEEFSESNEFEKLQKVLKRYINDLLDHIAVENDELFSITENLFTDSQLENMFFRFKDIDLELGQDLKNDLEKIPTELRESL